ncbi:MAG: hypothetical protein KJO69_11320 [Gammaproteobacteria bacterium]|nr:hypothetical protein [Gammaproteobacteria bacterium]
MATKVAPDTQEADFTRISNRTVIGFLATTVILAGSVFYDLLIDNTRIRLDELEVAHRALSQKVIGIQRDDEDCINKNISQDVEINNLKEWRDDHMRMMYQTVKESEVWKAGIEKDIEAMHKHIEKDKPMYYR